MAEIRFDEARIAKWEKTPEGFLKAHLRVAKIGTLRYRNADGSERIEHVSKEELFKKSSYDSLKGKPVTLEHPPVMVNSLNASEHLKGITSPIVTMDGDYLDVIATVTHADAIAAIENGVRECSCGYNCSVTSRKDGTFDQHDREYNHVAIVSKGRAGSDVRVRMDSGDFIQQPVGCWVVNDTREDNGMSGDLYQIDIEGKPFRVDADLYEALKKKDMKQEEEEDEDDMSMKKDMKDMKRDPEDEDEDDMSAKIDSLEAENQFLQARLDAVMEQLENFSPSDNNSVGNAIEVWEASRGVLVPAIQNGKIRVDSISVGSDRRLRFDGTTEAELKEAMVLAAGVQLPRTDSEAIDIAYAIVSQGSNSSKRSGFEAFDNLNFRADSVGVDARADSIRHMEEQGRKPLLNAGA
jgi:uncharacterized protein